MLYAVYAEYAVYGHIHYIYYVHYVQGGFFRSIDMYLKDHSPYLDSSFLIVNLLGNYSTSYYLFVILLTFCLPIHLAY